MMQEIGGVGVSEGKLDPPSCIVNNTFSTIRLILYLSCEGRLCSGLWSRGMMLASGVIPAVSRGNPHCRSTGNARGHEFDSRKSPSNSKPFFGFGFFPKILGFQI